MKFKVGDKVRVKNLKDENILKNVLEISKYGIDGDGVIGYSEMVELSGEVVTISEILYEDKCYKIKESNYWVWEDCMLEEEKENDKMKIRIKYFEGAKKLEKISKGDWIDLYANEDVFVPQGKRAMIPLGIAMELPEGYEAHVVPRSSTFKTWGIIQTNHMGIIDNSFCGDNDQWHMPVYCLESKHFVDTSDNDKIKSIKDVENGIIIDTTKNTFGTLIHAGDKIAQFRVMENQPSIEFEEVESLGNEDRGMCGTTGAR